MSKEGQKLTKRTYEDPEIVTGYIDVHRQNTSIHQKIHEFADRIRGKNVLDLGCGPGLHSYMLAKLGFRVVGLDYSHAMLEAAESQQIEENPPYFVQADIRDIGVLFERNSIDAIWASESLLHLPKQDIPAVLSDMNIILSKKGIVYIAIKGGNGDECLISESMYGKQMQREFTLWQEPDFTQLVGNSGFQIAAFQIVLSNDPQHATWLNYLLSK